MEAYIEYVIIDNFAMDMLILIITVNVLKLKARRISIFLSAVIGTVSAVIIPIVSFPLAVAVRIGTAPIMCFFISRNGIKKFLLTLLIFLIITFGIGGLVIAIFNMSVSSNLLIIHYPGNATIGLSAIGVIILFYSLKQLSIYFGLIPSNKYLYNCSLFINLKKVEVKAFYDSGNSLYHNKEPVIILSPKFKQLVEKYCGHGDKIIINTINGPFETNSYILEKVMIYLKGQVNTIYNVICIVSKTSFNHYDLLLHKEMIKEGK